MARRSLLLSLLLLVLAALAASVSADFAAPKARASHILVSSEERADDLAAMLDEAEDLPSAFAELAALHSTCPSARRGGDLGTFGRGQMVAEFDAVVFERALGTVHKVRTQFGWHLVLTSERTGMGDEDELTDSDDRRDLR